MNEDQKALADAFREHVATFERAELDRFMREGIVVNTRPMTKQVRRRLSN